MARTIIFCISDETADIQSVRDFARTHGMTAQTFSTSQWRSGIVNPQFQQSLATADIPTLVGGTGESGEGGKLLPFPGSSNSVGSSVSGGGSQSVATIDQLEARAIEQAIMTFRGNLTEAAKALGIGRATLYRKVKHYNIDPSLARRRRAA